MHARNTINVSLSQSATFCLDHFRMALGVWAPVALCTVAAAVKKTTVPRTAGASTGTGNNPEDSSKIVTQQTL